MVYETDLAKLATYTVQQWQNLLTRLAADPNPPRGIVRINFDPAPTIPKHERPPPAFRVRGTVKEAAERRAQVLALLAQGMTSAAVSRKLSISDALVARIKYGRR